MKRKRRGPVEIHCHPVFMEPGTRLERIAAETAAPTAAIEFSLAVPASLREIRIPDYNQ